MSVVLAASLLGAGVLLAAAPAAASSGRIYHIDNRLSACDNSGPATIAEPWCDLTSTDGIDFQPGDEVLLARGATWDQELRISGEGTASQHIVVGAYGSGDRPRIIRDGDVTQRALTLTNPSHVTVRDLELGDAGAGLVVYFDTTGHEDLDFLNLSVHNMAGIHQDRANTHGSDYVYDSAGLEFTGPVTLTPENPTVVTDVLIDGFEGAHNLDSIAFDWQGDSSLELIDGASSRDTMTNVRMRHLYLHDDDDGGIDGAYCPHSLRIANMRDVTVQDSVLARLAGCFVTAGTSEVIVLRADDIRFFNNMIVSTPETGSHDETGVDHEIDTDSIEYRGNYFADNAGAGLSMLNIHVPTDGVEHYDTDNTVVDNVFVNNALTVPRRVEVGGVRVAGAYGPTTGTIDGNLNFEPTGFIHTDANGTFDDFTIGTNPTAVSAQHVWYAAEQFSGTQGDEGWSYASSANGGITWKSMTYSAAADAYSDATGALLSAFDAQPGCSAKAVVARVWTAPDDGAISIRGTALAAAEAAPDAQLAVTLNGVVIWSGSLTSAGSSIVASSSIDDVQVHAGDILRFEVREPGSGADAVVSWVPAIAYTSL
ncbi:MAG: hypothetical protein QM626_03200 [Microbacterium sp.]|uniref:hypothetical protein n=1 Tax=Microbacterium sp. TaxID=51671 RepID=UPI0039E7164A